MIFNRQTALMRRGQSTAACLMFFWILAAAQLSHATSAPLTPIQPLMAIQPTAAVNLCVDAGGYGVPSSSTLVLAVCDGAPGQQWISYNGTLRTANDECLQSSPSGSAVGLGGCPDTIPSEVDLMTWSAGPSSIANTSLGSTSLCLTVGGNAGITAGAPLELTPCTSDGPGSALQQIALQPSLPTNDVQAPALPAACVVAATLTDSWVDGGSGRQAINLFVSNPTNQTIQPPWRVTIMNPSYQGIVNMWNWSLEAKTPAGIVGRVIEPWANLPANNAFEINFGYTAVVSATANSTSYLPVAVNINGTACQVVKR